MARRYTRRAQRIPRRARYEVIDVKRKGLTLDDVVRACVSLHKQKRSFGPYNVRLELNRGSYRDISRHLKYLALRDQRGRKRPCSTTGSRKRSVK